MATNHPPVSQKTFQKGKTSVNPKIPQSFTEVLNILTMLAALRQNTKKCLTFIIMRYEFFELLPETLPLRIFASLPSSLHMLYPMGKDQRLRETFDPHDSHSFKSETMNVQFRSSRVAPPETCDFSEC